MLNAKDSRVNREVCCGTDNNACLADSLVYVVECGVILYGIAKQVVGILWVARVFFRESKKWDIIFGKHSAYFVYGSISIRKQQNILFFVFSYKQITTMQQQGQLLM